GRPPFSSGWVGPALAPDRGMGSRRRAGFRLVGPRSICHRGGPMKQHRVSVAMRSTVHRELRTHLLRADGQEDICLATYRPSTGSTRRTAIVREMITPLPADREVHGNASIT